MNRGEVWWVNFAPSTGGEVQKQRPAVIVSNDAANVHLNRVQVVPITSNVSRLFPSEAFVTVRGKKHKAMAAAYDGEQDAIEKPRRQTLRIRYAGG